MTGDDLLVPEKTPAGAQTANLFNGVEGVIYGDSLSNKRRGNFAQHRLPAITNPPTIQRLRCCLRYRLFACTTLDGGDRVDRAAMDGHPLLSQNLRGDCTLLLTLLSSYGGHTSRERP